MSDMTPRKDQEQSATQDFNGRVPTRHRKRRRRDTQRTQPEGSQVDSIPLFGLEVSDNGLSDALSDPEAPTELQRTNSESLETRVVDRDELPFGSKYTKFDYSWVDWSILPEFSKPLGEVKVN